MRRLWTLSEGVEEMAALYYEASLNGDFIVMLSMYPYFENSAEEFHPHETLSTLMKLLSSLSSSIRCHISLFNAHETLMKPH